VSGPELSRRESEPDVLQRAAAALRAAHDGQREGSGFTRARILSSVAQRRRSRPWRWLVLAPLGSALLVGSAWAQSTGSWPRVWQAVAAVLPFVEAEQREPEKPAPRERRQRRAAPLAERPPAEPLPTEPPPSQLLAEPVAPPTLEPTPAPPPAASRARKPAASTLPPPPDPELRRFRAAHELHVQGDARAAIAAYEQYLQAYPSGRFVPEARYNSALDSLKVGDRAAARRLLQPFAAGEYGGYRRVEAERLLEALGE
jgi:hypothetical protein